MVFQVYGSTTPTPTHTVMNCGPQAVLWATLRLSRLIPVFVDSKQALLSGGVLSQPDALDNSS